MLYYTHLAFAFFLGLLSITHFNIRNQILFIILVLFAALLPDIDSPKSKLGKYIKPLMIFKHRGIFHSLLVIPAIVLLLFYFGYSSFALPIIIGYTSHLIGDVITKEGLALFYPFKFRIKGFIKTGGLLEQIISILLLILSGFYLLQS